MGVPKVIHYCWFGKGEMPDKEKECIETWKKIFPDYQIKCWNEYNFDYLSCIFSRQAYEHKQYAFVSDYARAKILYEHGGIYLDTDVKVIKKFPQTTGKSGFMAFERRAFLGTAVIGSVPKNPQIKELLNYYEKHHFMEESGKIDNIANVSILTDIMKKYGLVTGGEKQKVAGFDIFNREVFFPKKLDDKQFKITEETCAVHMCTNSWLTEREKKRGNNKLWINIARPILQRLKIIATKILGKDRTRKLEIIIRNKLR